MVSTDYALLRQQSRQMLEGEHHPLPALANQSALLYAALEDVNWAGFYLLGKDGSLLLGPFQGNPACMRIPIGRGACGRAAGENVVQLVSDVSQYPGYIACDSDTRSELVIPLCRQGRPIGVLDLDSPVAGRFTEEDAEELRRIMAEWETGIAWDEWTL